MGTHSGNRSKVLDVLYVPSTNLTLLSVDKLLAGGSSIVFKHNTVKVFKGSDLVLRGRGNNGTFPLDVELQPAAETHFSPCSFPIGSASGSNDSPVSSTAVPSSFGGSMGVYFNCKADNKAGGGSADHGKEELCRKAWMIGSHSHGNNSMWSTAEKDLRLAGKCSGPAC